MSMSTTWHPNGGAYKAEARQLNGTVWVTLEQDDGQAAMNLFFKSFEYRRSNAKVLAGSF